MPHFDRLGNDMSDDIADELAAQEEKAWGAPVVGSGTVDDMAADAEHYYYMQDELTGQEEHDRDCGGDMYEYCRHHPTVIVSNGMFDGVCGACEAAMEPTEEEWHADWLAELAEGGTVCAEVFRPMNPTCREVFGDCHLSQVAYTASVFEDSIPF